MAVDVAPPAQGLPDAVVRLVGGVCRHGRWHPLERRSPGRPAGMRGPRWNRHARGGDQDGAHNWRYQRAREEARQGRRCVLSAKISSRRSVYPRPAPRWARPARLPGPTISPSTGTASNRASNGSSST